MSRVRRSQKTSLRVALALLTMLVSLAGLAPVAGAAESDSGPVSDAVTEGAIPAANTTEGSGSFPIVEVTGHGWGHGRGLSQYGAYGYSQQGWTSAQILDHYYGGTTAGPVPEGTSNPDPNNLRVDIRANRGYATRVDVEHGTIRVTDGETLIVETAADSGQAVSVQTFGSGLKVRTAPSCDGPWTEVATLPATTLSIHRTSVEDSPSGLLRVCHPNGDSTWYDGHLLTHTTNGSTRTINVVSVQQYLRGVVPNESPASWPAAALEAQAVAARSYVLAGDTRQLPYADTCDTTLCQVYKGRYLQVKDFKASTAPSTDAAIAATAGIVRLSGASIARTEFSSSSGGYTAGGDFPAVLDEGDSIAANPNHDWSKTVNLVSFEESADLGELLGVEVTERNGLGEDGGRVISVLFTFAEGSITKTGNQARRLMGLKSDWFSVGPVTRTSGDGSAVAYIDHVFELFLGRAATQQDHTNWIRSVELGRRGELTDALALTDEWAGVMVDGFYQSALERPADAEGRAYWLARIVAGTRVESIGAFFYGSPEYFNSSGGTNEGFVAQLYRDLLGREADAEGLGYWSGRLNRGETSTEGVASDFYASIESRLSRVDGLYQQILLRGPDQEGHEYWAGQLLNTDDIRLASFLAASTESFDISQR